MNESMIDMEVLDYLLNSIKNWIINDILEDHTRDWRYLLAIGENRKVAKARGIELNLKDFDSEIINSLIKEFETNISKP